MAAHFDDAPLAQHDDAVGAANGGKPVGDDKRCPRAPARFQRPLQQLFAVVIEGGGGLVEDKNGRPFVEGAGDGQPLALAAGQGTAVVAQGLVVAGGQIANELLGLGGGSSSGHGGKRFGPELVITETLGPGVGDVLGDGAGEELGFLGHIGDGGAALGQAIGRRRPAVEIDLAPAGRHKAGNDRRQR